jgi:hypothetical protein
VGGAEVSAAVVAVVEMPRLTGFDQFTAAATGGSASGDEGCELAAAGAVSVAVASQVPAWLALSVRSRGRRASCGSRTDRRIRIALACSASGATRNPRRFA